MNSSQIVDYTGQKFHSLTAMKFIGYKETGKLKAKRRVWLFQCDCGNQKEIAAENVVRTAAPTKTCGCLKASIQKYSGLQALQYAVYTEGKYNEADITLEQFIKLSQEDCYYCGSPVAVSGRTRQGTRYKEPFTYHGLDRLDNSLPHSLDNCVAACFPCNMRKREWNKEEFLNWIEKVYNNCIGEKMKTKNNSNKTEQSSNLPLRQDLVDQLVIEAETADHALQLAARARILSRLSYDAKVVYLMKNEDPTKQNWIYLEKELNKLH